MNDSEAFEALRAREPIFHRPELGTSRADFERMTDEQFWEVGASGAAYDRAFILDELESRYLSKGEPTWVVSCFSSRPLGDGTYLVTYLLQQGARATRRSTLWRFARGEWKAIYHQGTPVAEAAPE